MQAALRLTARVLPGHRLEIESPELPEGEDVEVFVITEKPAQAEPRVATPTLMEFLASLPPGPRSAPTWEEIERTLQEDRDAWDR